MARGGKRPGAGRKKGAATKKTRAIADRAAAEGLTPLEVMLTAMRRHVEAEAWDEAAAIAKDAAPFVHPRLTSVDNSGEAVKRAVVRVPPKAEGGDQWQRLYAPRQMN